MSPDNAIVVFTSLGFAAVFLALVVGMDREDAEQIIANISGITPSGKRAAKIRPASRDQVLCKVLCVQSAPKLDHRIPSHRSVKENNHPV